MPSDRTRNTDGDRIRIRGARQNNLRNVSLDLPTGELIVLTGKSGSGKSSLAFDTLYAEGQRRYVETFSPYARQFLERMDRPRVDAVEGIPPAVAIGHANTVRTSRSTVGTMTELTDFLKLLFARMSQLHCRGCGRPVHRDDPARIWRILLSRHRGETVVAAFPVRFPESVEPAEVAATLLDQGFRRIVIDGEVRPLDASNPPGRPPDGTWWIAAGRERIEPARRARVVESIETALHWGKGLLRILPPDGEPEPFSSRLHCARCDIEYSDPSPNLFSFNNPLGACSTCRGFGRIIEIDPDLVVPDPRLSLEEGAIRPWTTSVGSECMKDLRRFCCRRGIPMDVPFGRLPESARKAVFEGDGSFYGVSGFFRWLETKTYKMHVRVLLSRYRAYRPCPACRGTRLREEALLYRLHGRTLPEIYAEPVDAALAFLESIPTPQGRKDPRRLLLQEIRARLRYLVDAGLGYLSLNRPSRTLSGGELERVHLAAAIGNALVNTLYVLDEPTVGLHPRDVDRLTRILEKLRDLGNTVLVVEHDPAVIRRADTLVDLGPGPGERGGRVVYAGPAAGILRARGSLTAAYLSRAKRLPPPRERRRPREDRQLVVRRAFQHNLKGIDVAIPLDLFVCITGVSGSGKSTLIHDVLYRNLLRIFGRPVSEVGACLDIEGADRIDDVVLVDQQPLSRSARSNPATYIGAWSGIRRRFGSLPEARKLGFGPGDFSFNSGRGRCERCGGSGFERIEMQFLSDVYLRCPACDGRRFREEILRIRDGDRSVADILEMTVQEALSFYEDDATIVAGLRRIDEVGLGYLRLGQPVTTLSGGEAQRLKLARQLAGARIDPGRRNLLLLDEPTTGLHMDDVAVLVRVLHRLVEAGQSVVVIEHNLDLIAQADHVIDLGPEGGDGGGRIVAAGTPEDIAAAPSSYTGRALAPVLSGRVRSSRASGGRRRRVRRPAAPVIRITGAREHNLRNLDVTIPRNRLTVISGVSGSGKSSLAFDVLYGEGQRRYLDTLSSYVRQYVGQLPPADVDRVSGIPPTVAIEQRISRGGRKSTVATITEIHNFLRLVLARLGEMRCPRCGERIREQTLAELIRAVRREHAGRRIRVLARLVHARKGYHREAAEWAAGRGYRRMRVDGRWVDPENFPRLDRYRQHTVDVVVGETTVPRRGRSGSLLELCREAIEAGEGALRIVPLPRGADHVYSTVRACPECGFAFPEPDPRLFSFHSPLGWCPRCRGLGVQGVVSAAADGFDEEVPIGEERPCRACGGTRLREEARSVFFRGRSIDGWTAFPVDEFLARIERIRLKGREREIGRDLLAEMISRARFLREVGLGYLGLDRRADTLSGGEAQRIRLAAQLGSNLRGVCYVLDEPTIGLHPRDNERLTAALHSLRSGGNTVVVVEHDPEMIRSADHVIDLGPGPGAAGGRLVAAGTPEQIMRNPRSVTGRLLADGDGAPRRPARPLRDADWITIRGARAHNLRGIDVRIPLGRFTVVCGVSGSGKSSLVHDVLVASLRARKRPGVIPPVSCDAVEGAGKIRRVCEVDQTPIGKTPRSVPATYIKVWDRIRRVFAETPEARLRGFGPAWFSFNSPQGRCPVCQGQGRVRMEMSFLPDAYVPCEACAGRRYAQQTLEIRYRGRTIADILDLTVDAAAGFFEAHPAIRSRLDLMSEVGLGYLPLGQTSPTLSGGESQRLKLVAELGGTGAGRTLYVLEEPTIGLHMADVERLLRALQRLVDAGNTVVVIEHNLDVIAAADYIVELGPGGGKDGGRIVFQGPPARLAKRTRTVSPTAPFLRRIAGGSARRS